MQKCTIFMAFLLFLLQILQGMLLLSARPNSVPIYVCHLLNQIWTLLWQWLVYAKTAKFLALMENLVSKQVWNDLLLLI